jgi:NADP-dependent aldehyde dehydrogenase
LFDICAARPSPIPFYGELGSVNPVVVLPGAARRRGKEVAAEVAAAILLRGGQVCTRPGLVFVPSRGADEFVACLRVAVRSAMPVVPLNEGIGAAYAAALADRAGRLGEVPGPPPESDTMTPRILEVPAEGFVVADLDLLREECFGPTAVLVRYSTTADLGEAIASLAPRLVAGLYADDEDRPTAAAVLPLLSAGSGRLVWNGPTTTLHVGRATHHGGGFPASTAEGTTSVGVHAIDRWLRPIAFEGFPNDLLPTRLRG